MKTAIFPGSFNPFTIGHLSIVERALPLFDRIVIAIGHNASKPASRSSAAERRDKIAALFSSETKVEVCIYDTLTLELARNLGAGWILRGVRSVADFEYERNMADINRRLCGIETVLLFSLPEHACISSSLVRELNLYGADTSQFLPTDPQNSCQ